MALTSLKPFVPSGDDFATAKQFFCDLGFQIAWEGPGLVGLELDGVGFLLQDFACREMQENLMLLVTVDDLDAWWDRIVASGVTARYPGVRAKPPTLYPWGQREVHLIDPAGVCWHFA